MSLSVTLRHRQGGFDLDVSFEAPPGVTALFGRSGSGKTTVISAVAGLLRPDFGRVLVDERVLLDTARGICVPAHKRRIGYVFQEGRLFPHLTVFQNLCYGRWFSPARPDGEERERIVELLGLGDLLTRRPGALSGGEKQRVAIGRALLSAPDSLLMDEPLAALDEARKAEILPYLQRLRDETRIPILYVSHSVAEVARIATTVVAMDRGRVVRTGSATEVLSDPEAVPALGVREAGSVIAGQIVRHHEDGLSEVRYSGGTLFLPRQPEPPGTLVRVRIEAKDVMLSLSAPSDISALNILPSTIQSIRRGHGPGVIVQLKTGEDLLLCRVTQRSADALGLAVGTRCYGVLKSVSVAKQDVG